jgi:hypothetical protein
VREEGTAKVAPLLAIFAADRAISDMAKAMSALLGERIAQPHSWTRRSPRWRLQAMPSPVSGRSIARESCVPQSFDPPNKTLANWRIVAFIIIMRYTFCSQDHVLLQMPIDAREHEHIKIEPFSMLVALATSTNEIGLLDSVLSAAVGR